MRRSLISQPSLGDITILSDRGGGHVVSHIRHFVTYWASFSSTQNGRLHPGWIYASNSMKPCYPPRFTPLTRSKGQIMGPQRATLESRQRRPCCESPARIRHFVTLWASFSRMVASTEDRLTPQTT
ncbi:hypothetical protein GDO81_024613 [Engystomops pustulosus]|uniref:Uncharacterized protein n=1 Tax=Engystomops pustulosus TaxID=76066 RepID=A0AAV6YUC8_ENGPU|nr:hypothetical protein GDO81_024613 [Engystomops pustulosus]